MANALQKNVALVENVPENSVTIIDGMSLVHKMTGHQTSFGDIAMTLLQIALQYGSFSDRIDVVFDQYKDCSIKNGEKTSW